jgi:hypothetical protein
MAWLTTILARHVAKPLSLDMASVGTAAESRPVRGGGMSVLLELPGVPLVGLTSRSGPGKSPMIRSSSSIKSRLGRMFMGMCGRLSMGYGSFGCRDEAVMLR